jgi:hypothetical protein
MAFFGFEPEAQTTQGKAVERGVVVAKLRTIITQSIDLQAQINALAKKYEGMSEIPLDEASRDLVAMRELDQKIVKLSEDFVEGLRISDSLNFKDIPHEAEDYFPKEVSQ